MNGISGISTCVSVSMRMCDIWFSNDFLTEQWKKNGNAWHEYAFGFRTLIRYAYISFFNVINVM